MKTCGRPGCERKANLYMKRRDAIQNDIFYCCDSCARADSDRRGSVMKSARMEKSLSVVHGGMSQNTLSSDPTTLKESTIQKEDHITKEMQRRDIMQIQRNSERNQMIKDGSISNEFANEIEKDPLQFGVEITQNRNLEDSLPDYAKVILASRSLVNQSIVSMFSLIKSVEENIIHKNQKAQHKHVDPAQVNAAANCAKQMAELMKMKIMLHKERLGD